MYIKGIILPPEEWQPPEHPKPEIANATVEGTCPQGNVYNYKHPCPTNRVRECYKMRSSGDILIVIIHKGGRL